MLGIAGSASSTELEPTSTATPAPRVEPVLAPGDLELLQELEILEDLELLQGWDPGEDLPIPAGDGPP